MGKVNLVLFQQLGLLCLHSLTGLFLKAVLLNHIEVNAVNLCGVYQAAFRRNALNAFTN